VSFTTGSTVSGDLTIALSVAGASSYQAEFDDVILTKRRWLVRRTDAVGDVERSVGSHHGRAGELVGHANGSCCNINGSIRTADQRRDQRQLLVQRRRRTNQYYVEVTNSAAP